MGYRRLSVPLHTAPKKKICRVNLTTREHGSSVQTLAVPGSRNLYLQGKQLRKGEHQVQRVYCPAFTTHNFLMTSSNFCFSPKVNQVFSSCPDALITSLQSFLASKIVTGHLALTASTKGSSRSRWTPFRKSSSGTLLDVPTTMSLILQYQDSTSARRFALDTSSSRISSKRRSH